MSTETRYFTKAKIRIRFKVIPQKIKAIEQIVFNFPYMFPTSVCFEKYNKKERSSCLCLYTPYMPVLALTTRVISSAHGTFCGN